MNVIDEEFKEQFPDVNFEYVRCVFKNENYICYKDISTDKKYLYDIVLKLWIKESTEYWRGIPIE
jgi:hypothetical protein